MLPLDNTFFEAFILIGLTYVVKESTNFPSGSILDLFFASVGERIGNCLTLTPLSRCSAEHLISTVLCFYVYQNFSDSMLHASDLPKRLWSRGNYSHTTDVLSVIDWVIELQELPTTIQYVKFNFCSHRSNMCCPRDCVSRHNGGTLGAPLKPLRVDSALRNCSIEFQNCIILKLYTNK